MKKYAFGVDIGGTTVKIGLFTTTGELLEDWEIKTVKDNGGSQILSDIGKAIDNKLEEKGISKDDVEGIGVGVPGPVLDDGTVKTAVNLGWKQFNIHDELGAITGLRIKAGNDANVAALGELWQGGGKGLSGMIMVTLGTGVGGGIIINGKILTGANGSAAEIGHMSVKDFDEEPDFCGCGKRGCLEQYASATGIVNVAGRYIAAHPEVRTPLKDIENFSAKDVFDLYKQGDAAALAIADEVFKTLGRALANISAVIDTEAFVIGGGVSNAGPVLLDGIRNYYVKYAFPASKNAQFKLATLGNKAGIYGSVKQLF